MLLTQGSTYTRLAADGDKPRCEAADDVVNKLQLSCRLCDSPKTMCGSYSTEGIKVAPKNCQHALMTGLT